MHVGPYDDKVMPAVMLFHDKQSKCSYSASKHFYNPAIEVPGEYDREDFFGRGGNSRLDTSVDAVMLRPGYKVYLYEDPKWTGYYEVFEGAYQEG